MELRKLEDCFGWARVWGVSLCDNDVAGSPGSSVSGLVAKEAGMFQKEAFPSIFLYQSTPNLSLVLKTL